MKKPQINMKHAAVFGYPVKHSLSPRLHGYWLRQYGIDGVYDALEVTPEQLQPTLLSLKEKRFCGVNLTVPHKEAAFAYMDHVEDVAQRIGAVNTVVVQQDGTLLGRNTDAYGFIENLKAHTDNLTPYLKKVVVLGAGGAARAVCVALLDAGAEEIIILNRTRKKAEILRQEFGNLFQTGDWEERNTLLSGATLLANTTSLGMQGMPPLELSLEKLPSQTLVTDIVYTPSVTPSLTLPLQGEG